MQSLGAPRPLPRASHPAPSSSDGSCVHSSGILMGANGLYRPLPTPTFIHSPAQHASDCPFHMNIHRYLYKMNNVYIATLGTTPCHLQACPDNGRNGTERFELLFYSTTAANKSPPPPLCPSVQTTLIQQPLLRTETISEYLSVYSMRIHYLLLLIYRTLQTSWIQTAERDRVHLSCRIR